MKRLLCAASALLVGLCLLTASISTSHAGELKPYKGKDMTWSIDRTTVALGETLQLFVERKAPRPGQPSPALDLSAIANDFLVIGQTSTSTGFGSNPSARESYLIAIVPKRSGQLVLDLPGLPEGGQPIIQVVNGGFSTPLVRLRTELRPLPSQIVQRQSYLLVMSVCTTGALLWKSPQIPASTGYVVDYLGERTAEEPESPEQQACSRIDWSYRLTPLTSGNLQIAPMPLEGSHFGRSMLFVPPPLSLEVQPLPAWLPDGLPIGGWTASWQEPGTVEGGQPAEFILQAQAAGTPRRIEQIVRQALQISNDQEWQAAKIRVEPQAGRLAAEPSWLIRLTRLAPAQSGFYATPALQLGYWDVERRALAYTSVDATSYEVKAQPLTIAERLMGLLAATLLIFAGGVLLLPGAGLLYWRRQLLRPVSSPAEIAAAAQRLDRAARAYEYFPGEYAQREAARLRALQTDLDTVRFRRKTEEA